MGDSGSSRRALRRVRLEADCGEDLTPVQAEWMQVFERLDQADGTTDGRIERAALLKWVSALDMHETIRFEANLNISPYDLQRLVSKADENKDGYVDKCEFLRLVSNRDRELTKEQKSLLHQYLRVAAYAEEYRWCPPPWLIITFTLLQTAIYCYHVAHFLTHEDHAGVRITWYGPHPVCSQLIYNPSRRHEVWRFFTYCMVHAGVQHILFNMLMQLSVGIPLEMSHGSVRVGIVYVCGVLAGSLGTSTLDPYVFLAGASGGVYALIAAHLATLILNWQEDIVIMRMRFRKGKATSAKHGHIVRTLRLVTVVLYMVVDTGVAIYNRHMRSSEGIDDVETSYIAHFSGALAGLLIGILVLKNRKVEHWETKLKVICVVVFVFLLVVAVVWNVTGNSITKAVFGNHTAYFLQETYGINDAHLGSCHYYI